MMGAVQHGRIGIFAFDDMELLDFSGPYEVFTTASRVAQKMSLPLRFGVQALASTPEPIRARAGLCITPDVGLDEAGAYDLLIVPGGVVDALLRDERVLKWLSTAHAHTRYTASICTGAFVLARAGVLRGCATTHWEDADDLRAAYPQLTIVDEVRWVQDSSDERVYSSAGISAGMDLSLHLLGLMAGEALAQNTARQMDYRGDWQFNQKIEKDHP